MTSFADIAFLLIIFFILVTTLQKQMGFLTDLPAGQKSQQPAEKTTSVKLHNAQILFNDEQVDLEGLQDKLANMELNELPANDEGRIVLLEATGNVPYQNYYEAMASISRAGGVIAIVREEEGGS